MSTSLNQFSDELDKLVHRYRQEGDLSYAEVVGALNMRAWTLMYEASGFGGEQLPDIPEMEEDL